MNKDTVLVTAISGDVGNSVLKCLAGSFRLIGCDIGNYPAGLDRVDYFQKVPYADLGEEYLIALENIIKNQYVSHLIPTNEEEIRLISRNRRRFEESGVRIIIQRQDVLDMCFDKYLLARRLMEAGFDVPESFTPEDFIEDGNEYLIKLRFSSGSKMIKRFKTNKEMEEIIKNEPRPAVIQRYIPSDESEYTIGVFSDGNSVRTIIFKRKLKNGYSSFVELVDDKAIEETAIKTAKFLKLNGSVNIQLRRHQCKNYIFEINPRLSGTVYFRHQLGYTDALWWISFLNGKTVEPYSRRYHKALGIREMNEKFLILE